MTSSNLTSVEREVRIAARPEIVFTDPEQMLKWQGVEVELDPRPGGIYRVQVNTLGHTTVGRFVEVVPHSRIVFTWGWDLPLYPVPAGSSTVEITLRPDGPGTLLHLRHSGLPDIPAITESHGEGWSHYLARLGEFAASGIIGPDPWRDGNMAAGAHKGDG